MRVKIDVSEEDLDGDYGTVPGGRSLPVAGASTPWRCSASKNPL